MARRSIPAPVAIRPGAERARRLAEGWPAALRLDVAKAMAEDPAPLAWQESAEAANHRAPSPPTPQPGATRSWRGARDVPTSYHLSVVVDDAAQGVTDVVRGRDLFLATGLHRLLQPSSWACSAPRYHHHRLVLDAAGHKLSKSRGAPSLRDLRREGRSPSDIRRLVGLSG